MNQHQDEDVVLGNMESGGTADGVLAGIEKVKHRLASCFVPERIQGLTEAMNYGTLGIELAIAALKDEPWDVQAAADWLLRQRQEPFVKQAQDEQQYQFKILIVDEKGQEINRQVKQGRFFAEQSASGVPLPMAYIPSGSFWMGSKETEIGRYSFESPQHLVTVSPLFMGIFPVTQAQWQAVAALPQVERILYPQPWGRYCRNDPDLPAVCISWYDAVEFCARLRMKTGRNYRLPSEAEWEYACRAGTTTPFHFGETITSQIANYNGNRTYADEPQSQYREEITNIGKFGFANAFGLYDMHGNIWEWCADLWHENYLAAPEDEKVWEWDGDTRYRVLRGGAWNLHPLGCRSAYRDRHQADRSCEMIGFRVAVSLEYPLIFHS